MNRSDIQNMIDIYVNAEVAVLKGKSYTIGGRSLTRENLKEIREGRHEWEQKLSSNISRSRGRMPGVSLGNFS